MFAIAKFNNFDNQINISFEKYEYLYDAYVQQYIQDEFDLTLIDLEKDEFEIIEDIKQEYFNADMMIEIKEIPDVQA